MFLPDKAYFFIPGKRGKTGTFLLFFCIRYLFCTTRKKASQFPINQYFNPLAPKLRTLFTCGFGVDVKAGIVVAVAAPSVFPTGDVPPLVVPSCVDDVTDVDAADTKLVCRLPGGDVAVGF